MITTLPLILKRIDRDGLVLVAIGIFMFLMSLETLMEAGLHDPYTTALDQAPEVPSYHR
jgi:hypothetical protein